MIETDKNIVQETKNKTNVPLKKEKVSNLDVKIETSK